jgi:hypothetical protein
MEVTGTFLRKPGDQETAEMQSSMTHAFLDSLEIICFVPPC